MIMLEVHFEVVAELDLLCIDRGLVHSAHIALELSLGPQGYHERLGESRSLLLSDAP